jgi:hypothetical protein
MSAPILGTLASCEIVIDRQASHNHLEEVLGKEAAGRILEEALSLIDAEGKNYIITETPCDEPGLQTPLVATTDNDDIVYAYRTGRDGQSRFALDRDPEPSDRITTILARYRYREGIMVLISALSGPKAEPEPWDAHLLDREAHRASRAFWAAHALVWEPATVDFSRPFDRTPAAPIWTPLLIE